MLLKTNTNNNITYLKFLLNTLKILGFEHSFNLCDKCKKDLFDSAFVDIKIGGVVCENCVKNNAFKVGEKERQIILRVSQAAYTELEDFNIDEEIIANVLKIVQTIFKINCNQ